MPQVGNIKSPSSLATAFLNQPPSCLEFHPAHPDYLVIGTYSLSEEKSQVSGEDLVKQTKTGSVQLWHLDASNSRLEKVQELSLPHAVFDLHFHPRQHSLLGIATSAATVSLYRISRIEGTRSEAPQIQHLSIISVHEDPMTPALFLAWTPENWLPSPPGKNAKAEEGFAVTFSDGRTSVFATNTKGTEITRGEGLAESQLESRESIETWFVALAGYQENISYMFTGNDFGSVNTRRFAWTENGGDYTLEDYQTQNLNDNARHHTAGVTSILPLPVPLIFDAPVLLTGSYDEYIRVYHATGRGTVLAETRLGGGVWRLQLIRTEEKQIPAATGGSDTEAAGQSSFLVLASCMHAGARIVRIVWRRQGSSAVPVSDTAGEWNIEILAQFTEHQSMNYASDFWKGGDGRKTELVCVSSSFYDKRLCLWKVEF